MSSKKNKKLTDAELQYFTENLDEISSPDELSTASGESSSEEDPFHNSGESDESYKPSSSSDEDIQNDNSDTEEEEGNITAENSGEQFEIPAMNGNVIWSLPTRDAHIPRFSIPDEIQCAVDPSITANSTPLEIFNKLFPRSLFIFIAKCTNQRIQMYNRNNKSATLTDAGEIMITLGCSLVITFDGLPSVPSSGNCHTYEKRYAKKFKEKRKMNRGECEFLTNQSSSLATRWQDTKEVIVLSNCQSTVMTSVKRKDKSGKKVDVPCPTAIAFYNEIMGGVDLADQMSGVYNLDRKSCKWWKKVFYRLLMISVVNSWVIYNDLRRTQKKIPLLEFLFSLSEDLIEKGKKQTLVKLRRNSHGRPSKRTKVMKNVGDHLPVESAKRRRCARCAIQKKERRTTTICTMCNVGLCKHCFALYHTS
ncbi:unnamed protein product [Acanthoscelides obtectus]|uniref:PiggyBac transposable element-derived protein domain-containing protein n=1 Tax=Acanthoscelides obtectus TaxID=200917 RepID=A0A9P0KHD0_ACAOB|nr:unnamed protein product [Acanthoscelides obtectus]CAK1654465.1 PiggyBac transposable element-derived protein 4 [Acanthoscelides obtectus]